MERSARLDLPLLLPEVKDLQDECVRRLIALLERRDGVRRVHVVRPGDPLPAGEPRVQKSDDAPTTDEPQLCLHYDPERLTLNQVTALARSTGAGVTERFGHAVIAFRAVGTEDDGPRLEAALRSVPGVTAAVVNLAGQVARVEFDRQRTDLPEISARLADAGATPTSRELPSVRNRSIGVVERGVTSEAGLVRPTELQPGPHAERAISKAEAASMGLAPEGDRDQEAPATESGEEPDESEGTGGWYSHNRELAWSLAAGALTAVGWVVSRGQDATPPVGIALFVGAYVFGARDNVGHLFKDIRRGRFHFNIDLLMVVAAIGAAALGEWVEGALLLFLFSLGHALEHYALGRARNAIKALAELAPQTAIVRRDGTERQVPIAEVRQGDLVIVKPAERVAVDGVVREGRSGVNQAPITGESVPVEKLPGEQVFAGSVNGDGALVVEVTAAVGDRTLDRVITLVAEAETQKAPTQQFTERFERVFVPIVLVADVLLAVVPPLLGLWSWSESFYRAMALLVAASPCALALGTPAAVLAGIAQAARKGVLIKGGAHLETLGTIDVFALDKTGTLTRGEPEVTDLVPEGGVTDGVLLATAAAVERRSQHPLARAIMKAAEARRLDVPDAGDLESVTGRGVRARVGTGTVEVGRLVMFEEAGASPPESLRAGVRRLEEAGRTTMVVRQTRDGKGNGDGAAPRESRSDADGWLGVIGVADEPRDGVRETLNQLRASGAKRIVMLTGDNAGVGNAVGKRVGVDEVRASLMPEDKVTAIRELAASGKVAMVGDGVNDAPALANATVGIAMGGAGTAAALETADVALMGDDLGRLPFAVGLSRRARAIIRQNLYVSLGVIGLLVLATVTGVVGIGPAVVVHEGSTLVVIANALRLLAYGGDADA